MRKKPPIELPIEIEEAVPFDDVMRQLLLAKPQHKAASKNKTPPVKKDKK